MLGLFLPHLLPIFISADRGNGGSYDLELDTRLSEETTVLVESYTVSLFPSLLLFFIYTELA